MSWQIYLVLGIFAATIAGLIRYQNRPALVFGISFMILYASGLVSTEQVLSSMSNQGLMTLILLMICSLALEKTRLLRLVAAKVIRPSYRSTWWRLFGLTVGSSALLNNTAVVSTMLAPIRNNPHHPAAKLLIPLSYAAILGGTLTLIGTSTNLIVNSLVLDAGLPSLGFFDFTLIGFCLVVVCGLVLWLVSRFLPEHTTQQEQISDYLIDAKVSNASSLIGKSIAQNGLRHLESLFLVEVVRNNHVISPVSPEEVLQAGDRLIFTGDVAKVKQLEQFDGLSIFANENGLPIDNLSEVVIRPGSVLRGKTLKSAGFRALFDAAVVAIRRDGAQVSGKLGEAKLQVGDYLVLAVGNDFKSRHNLSKNFIMVSDLSPENMLSGHKEWFAVLGFFAAIGLAAFELVPLFKSMSLLLGGLLFTRCLSSGDMIRRFPSDIWIIIATALLLSQALDNTGVIHALNYLLDTYAYGLSPFAAMIVVYLLTWLLTELVTNNAAAALLFPIAYGFAHSLDANPSAFIMAVAFGASASFISPYGYQTNLMVFNAGQYKLNDFVRIGLPVSLAYGFTAITAITLVYGL